MAFNPGFEAIFKHPTSVGYLELHRWRTKGGFGWKHPDVGVVEVFEIGEPIFLRRTQDEANPDGIWWIQAFMEVDAAKKIFVTATRNGGPGELGVPYWEPVKMNAMERLGAEYADP